MEMTANGIKRTESMLKEFAKGEKVQVEMISGCIYGFTSELGALRIFAKYQSNGRIHNKKVTCGYSENLKSHFICIDTDTDL